MTLGLVMVVVKFFFTKFIAPQHDGEKYNGLFQKLKKLYK